MLRSFEAAARHGSFRGAADELGLSPSAISHSVRQLEEALRLRLFNRTGRGVEPTLEGLALLSRLTTAFEEIRLGLEDVGNRGATVLRLHAAPSFAAMWLMPRLDRFTGLYPELELHLAADTDYENFTSGAYDLDIVYGPVRAEGVLAIPLGTETVTPLAAPQFAGQLRHPEDLANFPLIQSDQKQVRWDTWLRRNGLVQALNRPLRFDRSFMAVSAAANGMGIALDSLSLAQDEIAKGRLIAPFVHNCENISYIGHHLVMPQAQPLSGPARAFGNWLMSELNLPELTPPTGALA
ncbi:MAG: LysR substrate-binding domain-containing protein [Mangrovicoccus sp.]